MLSKNNMELPLEDISGFATPGLDEMPLSDDLIREVEELPNGDSVYEYGEPIEEEDVEEEASFYANLAVDFEESGLKKLSAYLMAAVEEDIESRKEWMDSVEEVKKYLGFSLEDLKDIPFKQATRTFDTTLATALIRFYATTRAELLPPTGPAGFKIKGSNEQELELKGENIKDWLNYYLTVVDKPYYADMEKFLLYLGLYGSVFRKVYYDPIIGRPISRFIIPQDFVVDNDCTSILESSRLTHIRHLSIREIILNIKNGIYREAELPYLKHAENSATDDKDSTKDDSEINLDVYSKRSRFPIYETHVYLNLAEFKDANNADDELTVPSPYIVTWCKTSMEVLSIRRNWEENDEQHERINYFVQYNYLPGFGIYGIGLSHLIGTNAITLTRLLRQLVDAGSFKNLPGGLKTKGFKQAQNDLIVGPGEFVEVDTGSIPLRDAFMPLPYSEPSQVLRELRQEIVSQTQQLASTSETAIADGNDNMPVGTTMALLETSNKIQSAVLRSIHASLSFELQLLFKMFKETIGVEQFTHEGKESTVSAEDFSDEIAVTPVSDPSIDSVTQRIMRAESTMKIASSAPQLHNMPEVYRQVYKALGVQDIDAILLPPPPPQPEQQQQVDPNSLLMADIEQRNAETEARERMANLKAEVDVFKAQLEFEKNKAKMELDAEIANLKLEVELLKEEMRTVNKGVEYGV